jgi:hypothetical protein
MRLRHASTETEIIAAASALVEAMAPELVFSVALAGAQPKLAIVVEPE